MRRVKYFINEAFRTGYANTVVEKMAKILTRHLGLKYAVSEIPLTYSNEYGEFVGFFVDFSDENLRVRFNFELGKNDKMVSIDVWTKINDVPDYTIDVPKTANVVQVLNTVEALLNGENIDDIDFFEASRGRKSFAKELFLQWLESDRRNIDDLQHERLSKVYEDFMDWASRQDSNGMSKIAFIKQAKDWLKENGLTNDFTKEGKIKKGKKDKVIVDAKEDSLFKDIVNMPYEEVFEMIRYHVKLVGEAKENSVFIYGPPGSGKSYEVYKTLEKENIDYIPQSGALKGAKELYTLLYKYKDDKVIVFDDFDSVFKNRDMLNILKAAMEFTYKRIITYPDVKLRKLRSGLPESFEFTSGIIFISNLTRIDKAIISRSAMIPVDLSPDEMIRKIKDNLQSIFPNASMEVKEMALEFLLKYKQQLRYIDLRQFQIVIVNIDGRMKMGDTGAKLYRWALKGLMGAGYL